MSAVEDLGANSEERQQQIVDVLVAAFEDLISYDQRAFLRKFRKMARDPDFGTAYGQLAREDHRRFVDAFRNGAIPGLPAS